MYREDHAAVNVLEARVFELTEKLEQLQLETALVNEKLTGYVRISDMENTLEKMHDALNEIIESASREFHQLFTQKLFK